jgi:hypothetical protein
MTTNSNMSRANGDIVTRLRQTRANMIGTDDEGHYWDCHDAAAEIERLQGEVAAHKKILVTINAVHAFREAMPPPPLLTDAERKAVEWYAGYGRGDHAATLRGLLERTQ